MPQSSSPPAAVDEAFASDFAVDFLEPDNNPEILGRLGEYEILDVIGRGGMGIVLKGHQRELNRYVAVIRPLLATVVTITRIDRKTGSPKPPGNSQAGVVIDSRGYILTLSFDHNDGDDSDDPENQQIKVGFSYGTEHIAEIADNDRSLGMTILKVGLSRPCPAIALEQIREVVDRRRVYLVPQQVTKRVLKGRITSTSANFGNGIPILVESDIRLPAGEVGSLLVTGQGHPVGILTSMAIGKKVSYALPLTAAISFINEATAPESSDEPRQPHRMQPAMPTPMPPPQRRRPAAVPRSPEAVRLLEQLHARESAAFAEAETIRRLQADGNAEKNKAAIAEHQRKLNGLLGAAFDLKLNLEALQVKELRSRLSRLEQQIGQRQALRERIIDRRAAELVEDQGLQWDPPGNSATDPSERPQREATSRKSTDASDLSDASSGDVLLPPFRSGRSDGAMQPKQDPALERGGGVMFVRVIHGPLIDAVTGHPVAGADVGCEAIIDDWLELQNPLGTVTNASGVYYLKVPSPGIYNVFFKSYDAVPHMTAEADDGILVEPYKVSESRLWLVRGRMVAGQLVDGDGKPVAGNAVCYSAARPVLHKSAHYEDTGSGSFKLALPPGRAYLYAYTKSNAYNDASLAARGFGSKTFEVPLTGDGGMQITLNLATPKGDEEKDEWVKRSTPGTQILGHADSATVTGIVVDGAGKPVRGAKVFPDQGPIEVTNDRGEFRVAVEKGQSIPMYAFVPGFHVWCGQPTAGDKLKVVLERKRNGVQPAATESKPPQRE